MSFALLGAKASHGAAFVSESPIAATSSRVAVPARLAFLSILIALLVAFGGIDALPLDVLGAAMFALAAGVLFAVPMASPTRRLIVVAIMLSVALGAWVLLQSLPVSTGSSDSLASIVPILLPFAVFVVAVELWPTEADALKLLRLLGIVVVALAAYGLLQLALSPERVLLVRPAPDRGSLTATLLSRDAAAILFGCVGVLFLVRTIDLLRRLIQRQDRNRDFIRFLLTTLATLLALGALLLTQSKVGIGASTVALAISAGLTVGLSRSKRSRRFDIWSVLRRVGLSAGVAAATALVMGVLAGRILGRGTTLADDGVAACRFPGLVRMLTDNWLLGTGAGTFASVAPSYDNPDCGISQPGVTAHSGLLEGWITLGLPFAVATIAAGLVLAIVLIRGLANRRRMRWVPIVGIGMLTLIAASSIWDASIQLPGLAALIASLLAPVCVICVADPQHSS